MVRSILVYCNILYFDWKMLPEIHNQPNPCLTERPSWCIGSDSGGNNIERGQDCIKQTLYKTLGKDWVKEVFFSSIDTHFFQFISTNINTKVFYIAKLYKFKNFFSVFPKQLTRP